MDYQRAGESVYFPSAHRYLAHVSGDPLISRRADRVIHEIRRGVSIRGRTFAAGEILWTPYFSPDGRWLLLESSNHNLELVDLGSLKP